MLKSEKGSESSADHHTMDLGSQLPHLSTPPKPALDLTIPFLKGQEDVTHQPVPPPFRPFSR